MVTKVSPQAEEYVNTALDDVSRLLAPELRVKLSGGYHGVVGVTLHIQNGTINHAKLTTEQTVRPSSPKVG